LFEANDEIMQRLLAEAYRAKEPLVLEARKCRIRLSCDRDGDEKDFNKDATHDSFWALVDFQVFI
jgi:hypothetical protein